MAVPSELAEISLNGIVTRCRQESDLFFQRKEFDPRYCFDLFRRAFLLRSEEAWECVFRQYRRLILSWIERHPLTASLDEEPDYFLNRAFEKMWAVISPQKFGEFPDLKSVLRYLQLCVHSVIVDHARAREQAALLPEDSEPESLVFSGESSDEGGVESVVSRRLLAREVWGWVAQRLKTEQERLLVFAMFTLALKPREVLAEYPGVFRSIDEVYMVNENLFSRLRRDQELLQALSILEGASSDGRGHGKAAKRAVQDETSLPSDAGKMGPSIVKKGR